MNYQVKFGCGHVEKRTADMRVNRERHNYETHKDNNFEYETDCRECERKHYRWIAQELLTEEELRQIVMDYSYNAYIREAIDSIMEGKEQHAIK